MSSVARTFFPYGLAAVLTALAVLLRWLLAPSLGEGLPFVTVAAAVAGAAWLGGQRPGILALVLGLLACDWLFVWSQKGPALDHGRHLIDLCANLITGSIIIAFAEARHAARRHAEASQRAERALNWTKRMQTEEEVVRLNQELQRRAEELQTILDILPIGVAIAHDPQCRRITHNPYMSELLNVPAWANASLTAPQDERPTNFTNYRDGKEVPTSELPMQIASTGAEVRDLELDLFCEGQEPRTMLYYARPLLDEHGQVRGSVGACLDITARKRAEQALRLSEQRLVEELEAMTQLHALNTRLMAAEDLPTALDDLLESAIVTTGADFGNVQLYDPQTEALEIVAHRGFRQDFLDYFRMVRIDEGSCCAQAMQTGARMIIEDVEVDPTYERHRAIAAATGYRAVQSTPLQARDGSILGMLSTHFHLPQRVSKRNERFLDLLARHAADVILRFRYEQALQEADRRKDEFLATLAHELRNPLAPIRSAVAVLNAKGLADADLKWNREVIERQVGQMARLLDDLLDVSRITRNKLELRKEPVELAMVVASAVETSRPVIDGGGHNLAVTLPPVPVYLGADPVRLAQVFGNLLNNAAKYTDRGGHIRLTAEVVGLEVVVSVADNGIGITPDVLPRLFERFAQATSALERSQGGLGIGLSLVRGLVELHGGTVEGRSEGVGKGSEFIVRLPVAAAPMPVSREQTGDQGAGRIRLKSRILVVDDNRDAADSLAMLLQLGGHDIEIAYDGLQAVRAAEVFRPDVVLLDIGLPGMNGYEAARHIREQPWGKDMVLIALTGWGQDEDKRRATEAGFDHHLTKPVEPATLEELLAGTSRPCGT
jgi:signal transduction histidine kinase